MNPENVWFLNSHVKIHIPSASGQDGISVMEHTVAYQDSPPLHLHRTEDEIFHVLDGEFLFQIGEEQRRGGPGTIVLAPKGVKHTYVVESSGGGRFITMVKGMDFESFVRTVGRAAERDELPTPSGPPSKEMVETLAEIARRFGIEFVGPPLSVKL